MRKFYNKKSTELKRRKLRFDMTDSERLLWNELRNRQFMDLKFRRQFGIGEYIVDFYCVSLRLVIELDGKQHFTEAHLEYDRIRADFMSSVGIKTIRFANDTVMTDIDSVLGVIKREVNSR